MTDQLQLTPVSEPPIRSYWNVVFTAFWRGIAPKIALGFVVSIALMAVIVPFIANGQPYTVEIKNSAGVWQRHYPLFTYLTRLDYLVLMGFATVTTVGSLCYFGRNRISKSRRWLISAGITTGMVLLGLLLWYTTSDPSARIMYRDYQAGVEVGTMRSAVYAPIPWHFGDQEALSEDRTNELPSWLPWVAPTYYAQARTQTAAGTRSLRPWPDTPSWDHLLGTDGVGRDVLARMLWSTRIVMGIGFISEVIALLIGITVGAWIGYYAGKADLLGMRVIEIFEAVPTFLLILIFVATYGRNIFMIMIILGLVGWTGIARFVRAEFFRLRKLDYVSAAIAVGMPVRRVLFRHMLPNGLTPVIVAATFGIAGAVMSESGLSFLGVGIEPPLPSWGSLLNEAGNPAETFRPWLAIPPGIAIFLTVLTYNILGERMRDAIDPRTNKEL